MWLVVLSVPLQVMELVVAKTKKIPSEKIPSERNKLLRITGFDKIQNIISITSRTGSLILIKSYSILKKGC